MVTDREIFRIKIPGNKVKYQRVKRSGNVFEYNRKMQYYIQRTPYTLSLISNFLDLSGLILVLRITAASFALWFTNQF